MELFFMKFFKAQNIQIAYLDEGEGEPILLIHGFASNARVNWVDTNWVKTLLNAGYRVIAIDNRGHGESEKIYDQEAYILHNMAQDSKLLLEHLSIEKAHIMGFSMGARITAYLTMTYPEIIKKSIFAGLGYNMVRGMAGTGPIAEALEAPSIDQVVNATARTFRAFAEATGSDLKALSACIRASRSKIEAEDLAKIVTPVLVAVGTEDVVAGPAAPLADIIPNAKALDIPKRDHMKSVGDKVYMQGVLDFLKETNE